MLMVIFHTGKAMLPGIEAYTSFFSKKGWEVRVLNYGETFKGKVDVEWHFMGTKGKRIFPGSILVHEYASASVQPLGSIKDLLKKTFLPKPDLRIFLNEQVKRELNFDDNVPFAFRDIGIPSSILAKPAPAIKKEFDFIFPGSMHPYPYFRRLLKKFTEPDFSSRSLLVLTSNFEKISKDWEQHTNIKFLGPVSHGQVFNYIRRSRYGLNLRPPVAPFTYQTATKVLEFIACQVPVITTNSPWLASFIKEYGGNYYILKDDLSNFDMKALERFPFEFTDISNCTWDAIINNSGIEAFLISRLKEKISK